MILHDLKYSSQLACSLFFLSPAYMHLLGNSNQEYILIKIIQEIAQKKRKLSAKNPKLSKKTA